MGSKGWNSSGENNLVEILKRKETSKDNIYFFLSFLFLHKTKPKKPVMVPMKPVENWQFHYLLHFVLNYNASFEAAGEGSGHNSFSRFTRNVWKVSKVEGINRLCLYLE